MAERWDETWHRLLVWTTGQAPAERLAAQVLLNDGFTRLDPSHPLGGPDGKKDAVMQRDGARWVMAVYFPRGQQAFTTTKTKFASDLAGLANGDFGGFAFVTNQEITLAERDELRRLTASACEIYHLERIVAILDQPVMGPVRTQYLSIGSHEGSLSSPQTFFVHPVLPTSAMESHLLGRVQELHALEEFLVSPQTSSAQPHIAVINGMPGVGKTALAVEVAANVRKKGLFRGGAIIADFRGYDENPRDWADASRVLSGLLAALGADQTAPEPAVNFACYRTALESKERDGLAMLLIFDNVADVRQFQEILPPPGIHRVIITSRNTLGPRVSLSKSFTLSTLSYDQSVGFLAQCDESRFADQSEGLGTLARLCGGLPIALQLVSHILSSDHTLAAVELADELDEEATRLAGLEFEDAAIRAVFRGSYLRLSSENAKCFRYLAVHPGSELSVMATASLLGVERVKARQAIRRLESANLIGRAHEPSMWRLHDLLRLYGREIGDSVDAPHEQHAALRRLFEYYFDATQQVNSWLNGRTERDGPEAFADAKEAIAWAGREHANIVACISAASEIGSLTSAWGLAIEIDPYLCLRGDFSAAIEVSESAVAVAQLLGDKKREADALNNLGLAFNFFRRHTDGKSVLLRARMLFREIGDKEGEARVLTSLAESMRGEGEVLATIPTLKRAVRLYTEAEDGHGLGYALTNLGTSLRESHQYWEAIEVLASIIRDAALLAIPLPSHR